MPKVSLMKKIWRKNFAATAIPIARAALFALPMPARHAASVSTPASATAETEDSLTSSERVAASSAGRVG